MEKMRQWSVLTAVGVLVVLVAGWFLLVSPQRSHAADLRTQAASEQSNNDTLRARLAQLEQQKKGLPEQQKLLDEIAAKIPDNPALPTLIRQLSGTAQGAGVDLDTMAPGEPAPVAVSPLGTTATSTTTPPLAIGTSSLVQIPVTVTVKGNYFELYSFFRGVEKLDRAFLVSEFTVAPLATAATGAPGAPALPSDTLTAELKAVVFESPAAVAAAPTSLTPPAAK
jgi:type IV pilus assembly protein PilO